MTSDALSLAAELKAADRQLAEARWLLTAAEMALEHPEALACVEDLPIAQLLKVAIPNVVRAAVAAEEAMRRAEQQIREAQHESECA